MSERNQYSLILGSKSPRRKELLGWLNIPFEVQSLHVDEKSSLTIPSEIAMDIARQKGLSIYSNLEKSPAFGKKFFPIVVGADTIVILGDKIFGKPEDRDDAKSMLLELAGKVHKVITAVYIGILNIETAKYQEKLFFCQTDVEFEKLSVDILENYLETRESLDKAGAYGIQGAALTFIKGVNGSYSNVVGFPLDMFVDELKTALGFQNDMSGKWRELIHGATEKSNNIEV